MKVAETWVALATKFRKYCSLLGRSKEENLEEFGGIHVIERVVDDGTTPPTCVEQRGGKIRVRNTRTVNRTGQFTGYKLLPGSNCLPLAGPEAKFLRRAAFLKHNLWVTSYSRDEMYPGGEFPNQNPRVNEGLATWVKKNRSLEETDVVLWYVFGITHIPRLEDWPVMPVDRLGFILMPHGFFNCSPAVDVPPSDSELKENAISKPSHNILLGKL